MRDSHNAGAARHMFAASFACFSNAIGYIARERLVRSKVVNVSSSHANKELGNHFSALSLLKRPKLLGLNFGLVGRPESFESLSESLELEFVEP